MTARTLYRDRAGAPFTATPPMRDNMPSARILHPPVPAVSPATSPDPPPACRAATPALRPLLLPASAAHCLPVVTAVPAPFMRFTALPDPSPRGAHRGYRYRVVTCRPHLFAAGYPATLPVPTALPIPDCHSSPALVPTTCLALQQTTPAHISRDCDDCPTTGGT